MKDLIESVKHIPTVMTVGGGLGAAGAKAVEQNIVNQYEEGSLVGWVADNAIVLGIGIAAAGLLIHFASFAITTYLKLKSDRNSQK